MKSLNTRFPGKLLRRFNSLVLLNISGLALGLSSVIFIAIWVSHELSYDRFFKNAGRIFRVESLLNFSGDPSVWQITPAPLAASVINDFPEVEDAVVMYAGYSSVIKVDDKLFTADNLYYTTHSYFNIFSTDVLSGDRAKLLEGPDNIVISRRISHILFGDQDPVGRQVLLNNTDLLTVVGVIEDSPTNTHLKVDYLVPISLLKKRGDDLENWGRIDFLTYIMLKEQTDPVDFNKKISGYWQPKISAFTGTLFINPLTRLYLYRDPGLSSVKYPYGDKGPIGRIILFSVIGFVLLLIACINFINLSTAFASQRAREIGIRKVSGAGRLNLIPQLFGESLLQTSIATLAAILIVIVLLPVFNKVSGIEFSLSKLFSAGNVIIYLILALLTGIISGMYPALVLSSFNPVKVIKPMPEDVTQGSGLRKILVVVQFGLAIVFIFCILVINRQISHMQQTDLGFDKEGVMVVSPKASPGKIDVLAEEIEKMPGIKAVAVGGNVPVNMGNFNTLNKWDGNISGKTMMFFMMQVDDKYLDLLNIRLVDGRQFNTGTIAQEVIINETAVKKMAMENPVGKVIWMGNERYNIIGVVKDFHFHTLKDEIQPVLIYKNKDWWKKMIFVKLAPGNHFNTVDNIIGIVKKSTPDFPPSYMFLDQEVQAYYDEERRLSTLINAATVLAIVISCIGLFSLTAFTIRKKRKEIGIRKAYGASIVNVLFMLQKDFGKLLLISAVIALPAGYFIISKWLSSYASHVRINAFYFLAALLVIVLISSITLVFNTVKAASLNPADTLRNE